MLAQHILDIRDSLHRYNRHDHWIPYLMHISLLVPRSYETPVVKQKPKAKESKCVFSEVQTPAGSIK
jgi:hypothetical protein